MKSSSEIWHATRIAKFWSKVNIPEPDVECWLWCGTTKDGYGYFGVVGKRWAAHRLSYTLINGPIPDGLEIDHLCRNRTCVNPAHLEVVDSRTNTLRGFSPFAINARKTECKRGHQFTADNTHRRFNSRKGRYERRCRECDRTRGKRQEESSAK